MSVAIKTEKNGKWQFFQSTAIKKKEKEVKMDKQKRNSRLFHSKERGKTFDIIRLKLLDSVRYQRYAMPGIKFK